MEDLMHLIKNGVTASHVIDYIEGELLACQFRNVELGDDWAIKEQDACFVNLYHSACAAFRVGSNMTSKPVFRVAMAHSDYPCLQVKPDPVIRCGNVTKLNVEIYGGMYQKSWLDRPLGIAGKVVVKGEDVFTPQVHLYKSEGAVCIVPSLAIHMDRELNQKGALDVSKEMVPIASLSDQTDLLEMIAKEIGIQKEEIIDYDLSLYNIEEPVIVGMDRSMIAAPKLDNLTSVAAILAGLKDVSKVPDNTVDVMVVFDNEEVGSLSKQGADSELLSMLLQKIGSSFSKDAFSLMDVATQSFMLSVDVAHANHPNYEEKSDATNKAHLGKGISLKRSVAQKYGTTAESAAVIRQICEAGNIPYTIAINKSGISGGSTLGPIATSHIPFPCADVGMPILAMHSATELGARKDYDALKQLLAAFYSIM